MAEIFSDEWMNQLKDAWNAEPEVKEALAKINFSSIICCGFKNEENPRGVFVVENGEAVRAGDWSGEEANWDMRADRDNWMKWIQKPLGMTSMGMAVATGKLKFAKGDFKAMMKDPGMASPFVKSFALMAKIGGE
ncbi:SCP-2 sterol transfer family protein [Ectothiorhodospiraceae bacterium BW-2]|nr:SCP-2 sterol transfer family protein [Ectothiorhodospiraceae bacterium BW-2]